MAVVCYASTGSNTSPYETWAKAATAFATALAAASSGDTVQVDMENIASGDAEVAGNTTWTVPNGVTVHIGTQNGASGISTGTMGTTYWFGNSADDRDITLNFTGYSRVIGGLTLRADGFGTSGTIFFNRALNGSVVVDNLRLWHASTTTNSTMHLGSSSARTYTEIYEFILDVERDPSATNVTAGGRVLLHNANLDYATSFNGTSLFNESGGLNGIADLTVLGGDLSSAGSGAALVGDSTRGPQWFRFENVVLPASFVMQASQTNAKHGASAHTVVSNCSSSGSAVPFAYADVFGELRVDTGIYLTAGIASASWKIATTAACSPANAFCTPWITQHKAAATVEPKFEVLRDGSATAFTDEQFWMENLSKLTASSVDTTLTSTRGTGTNIPTGAGTGSWTGEGGTAWSGELTVGSVVLEEDGYTQSRICAGVPSATLYVDIGAVG